MNCDYCDKEFLEQVGIVAYGESGGVTVMIDGIKITKGDEDAMRFCSIECFKSAYGKCAWFYTGEKTPLNQFE